jgi:hypothetical protein
MSALKYPSKPFENANCQLIVKLILFFNFQAGEMAHKAHVKEAMFATNRKDWETQIMAVHVRRDAMVHHRERMTGMFWILLQTIFE